MGGSEEILGEITREIHSVAENLSLTPEQRQTRLQQLADNQIRQIQEEEAVEEKQRELFGIRPPSVEQEAADQASANFWVNPAAMLNLVVEYLGKRCGTGEYVLGEKPLKTLRVNEQGRRLLLEDFLNSQSKGSVVGREWSEWLKGSNQHLAITVDPATAKENPKAVLITPVHPLAQQAARALVSKDGFVTCLKVKSNELPPGAYPFAIHQWTRKGVREDVLLQPVSREPKLVELFPRLIAEAVSCDAEVAIPPTADFDALESDHYALFARARAQHQERERELVAFQKASLETSHRARAANLGEMIANAGNEKIRLMRTVELQNAETDFRRRMDQLDLAASQADILSQQIARGDGCRTDLALMNDWFEQLQQDRREWLASTRKNKFERGIFASVVDKYPDPVHFVYELLQNAEDQGASWVKFRLESRRLVFEHDGNPFTPQDVENITGIGNTQKVEQANKIGRFGLGFKSVFVITDQPEIHTRLLQEDGSEQPFSFRIESLVVPLKIDSSDEFSGKKETTFTFPFREAESVSLFTRIGAETADVGCRRVALLAVHHGD